MARQREDPHLLGKVRDLNNGGTGGEYVTDDEGLLWYAPPGSILRLAIPRSLVPGVLAFVHTTYGHPGVARTTELTRRKYHWTSLKSDVRDYVLSCGCRRLKRSTSQRVAMLPARFLKPWEVLEMDIHDMGARSEAGNRLLLVVVDRASKFLFAYPLPNKKAEGVARKLLELLLTFGIPLSLRSDPGTEFTAEVVQHLCKWLNVAIDYGPTDHPRAQGSVERLGGWIHETLTELCKSWPRRWDEYVQPALWLHRTTPDPRLPNNATPFRLLFGRDCRTQMDATSPHPDNEGANGLHNLIADKSENLRQVQEVRKDQQQRHEQRRRRREHQNVGIRRTSTGTRVKPGDLVLVKEADSALHNDYVHTKLTHDRWTGPWTVTAVITPGLCYRVTLQGRRERVRRAAASHLKPYHLRPQSLRHDFGDEYAHFAWGPDLGLMADSTLASPLYTLVDRCTIQFPNGSWEWRYRGRYLNGSLSGFISESECLDSFTPMQLDVFHALWELYQHPCHRPRPAGQLPRGEHLAANRAQALLEVPIGTVVWRDFTDQQGRTQRCRTEVYDYKTPYWRVRHADGDWEELTRTEVEQGRSTPSAFTESTTKVSSKSDKLSSNTGPQPNLGNNQGYHP